MIAFIVVAGGPERGGEARRGTRLAAPSAAASAISNLNPVERPFRFAIYPDAFFDGRRLAASGIADRAGKLQAQPPISFLGLGRALQPSEQSPRCLTQTLHFLTSIGRSFHKTKDRREDRSCRTPCGANPPHLRTSA